MGDPPGDILASLGIRVVAPLGGRMNRHWRVEGPYGESVLRRWAPQSMESIGYERQLVTQLKAIGWPVALLDEPVESEGRLWSLSPLLLGKPRENGPDEWRARGRLLAEFHASTVQLEDSVQRPGWRRCEEILADPDLDRVLSVHEAARPEEIRILRWHLDRARLRIEGLGLAERPGQPIHGDFTAWNLLFEDDRLTGLIDFELAHTDHRVADFALAWRGKYDGVLHSYEEVSPLEPWERAALVPVWWAWLLEGAYQNLRHGRWDDGWTVGKLLARSPAMEADAEPWRP